MANETGDVLLDLQRRDLQLPASCAPSSKPGPSLSLSDRHRSHRPRLRGVGRGVRRRGSTACSRSALWDGRARRLLLARDRYGDQAALLLAATASSCSSPPRSRRCSQHPRVTRQRRSARAARILHVSEPLHRSHAVRRHPHVARRATRWRSTPEGVGRVPQRYWDYHFREPDAPNDDPTRVHRGAASAVRAGGESPAGERRAGRRVSQRRHGLRRHHGGRGAAASEPRDVHRRLRPVVGVGSRDCTSTSAAAPRRCRTSSRPSTTKWCCKAGDMERVMPELIWHQEDLRVGQCYPNYYVVAAGQQVRQGRARRDRRRRALRRLSVALLPCGQQPRLRRLRAEATTTSGSGWCPTT